LSFAFAPTQAAEFSGPGKHAIVLYSPDWADSVLMVLQTRPAAYEAAWSFAEDRRAHVLNVDYAGGPSISVALIDGIHNAVLAKLARGAALVLSPFPLYRDTPEQQVDRLFDPDEAVVLPELPNPLGQQ
jgi:hypothetical protein